MPLGAGPQLALQEAFSLQVPGPQRSASRCVCHSPTIFPSFVCCGGSSNAGCRPSHTESGSCALNSSLFLAPRLLGFGLTSLTPKKTKAKPEILHRLILDLMV